MKQQRPTLMFSDQHVFPLSSFSRLTLNGSTNVIDEHDETYRWIAHQIREHKPGMVVNLGDNAHNFGNLDSLTLRCLWKGYHEIRGACEGVGAQYYQLLGNHDFENEAQRIHCFPFVNPVELVEETMTAYGSDLFVPFYRDPEQVTKTVTEVRKRNPNIRRAFIHLDLMGAAMNAYMAPSKKGVDPELFKGIRTFAGHYHHPQNVGDIMVVGSTGYRSFADCVIDTPRGIVLDIPGKKAPKRIENPHTSIYFSAEIDNVKDLRDIPKYVDKARTYFRVKFPETMAGMDALEEELDEFLAVRMVPTALPKSAMAIPEAAGTSTPSVVIEQFIRANPPVELPVEHVQLYAQDLLEEVSKDSVAYQGKAVRFAGLTIRNFLPIGEVSLFFDQVGVCYVDGRIDGMEEGDSNGAGKSSVFEALYWCLFDDLIREGSADDVVNSATDGNCMVCCTFYIGGDEHIVTRMRKDDEKGDYCSMAINGEKVSEGWEETNKRILKTLGCDKTIFKHTTFLVDTLKTRFTHINQKERVALLESILMTEVYGELANSCHNLLRDAQSTAQTLSEKATSTEGHLKLMEGTLATLVTEKKQRAQRREVANQSIRTKIKDSEATLASTRTDLSDKGKQVDKMLNTAVDLNLIRESAEENVSIFRKEIEKVLLMQERLQEELDALQAKRAKATKAGICPYCGAKPAHAIDWSNIAELKTKLKGTTATLEHFNFDLVQATALLQKAAAKHTAHMDKMRTLKDEIFKLKTQIEHLPSQIKSLKESLNMSEEDHNSETEAQLKRDIIKYRVTYADTHHDMVSANVEIEVYAYLETVFGPKGCRLWVLNDAVTVLGSLVADHIEYLSRGQVRADLMVDEKGISMDVGKVGPTGGLAKKKYGMASSGERRKVDIGIQLALSVLSSTYSGFRSNVLFIDEIDDKLDASSRQRMVELLDKIAEDKQQAIFIASHYKEIKSMTTRTMTMLNRDGVSSLVTEEL